VKKLIALLLVAGFLCGTVGCTTSTTPAAKPATTGGSATPGK
jgi:hypothetical protein